MSGLLVCALMAALVGVGLTSPVSKSDDNTKQGGILPQLLARREAVRNAAENVARREQDTQMSMARMERMAHLSEDQRELMSKQIIQAISGTWGLTICRRLGRLERKPPDPAEECSELPLE
ncbi:unnamed protein product [Coregonus sp. 'balchen']|nr:unnamed protein product [Coregonus sp. 'balchen']